MLLSMHVITSGAEIACWQSERADKHWRHDDVGCIAAARGRGMWPFFRKAWKLKKYSKMLLREALFI